MLFLGHIAVSLLVADATGSDRAAAVAGNLVPDVVDKAGAWVLRVLPGPRHIGHGLPFALATIMAARGTLKGERWRGFALGYATHLLTDLYAGGRVPWLAPFRPAPPRRRDRLAVAKVLTAEVAGALLIWALLRHGPGSS
jgi:hypothetical protein